MAVADLTVLLRRVEQFRARRAVAWRREAEAHVEIVAQMLFSIWCRMTGAPLVRLREINDVDVHGRWHRQARQAIRLGDLQANVEGRYAAAQALLDAQVARVGGARPLGLAELPEAERDHYLATADLAIRAFVGALDLSAPLTPALRALVEARLVEAGE